MSLVTRLAAQLRALRAVRARLAELEEAVSTGDLTGIHHAIEQLDVATARASHSYGTLVSELQAPEPGKRSEASLDEDSTRLAQLKRELETELTHLREQRTRTLHLLETLFTLSHDLLATLQEQLVTGTGYARRATDLEEQRLVDTSA